MDPETDSMGLKVRELLKEVQLDPSATKTLDRAVSSVIDAIKAIPEQEASSTDALGFVRDLGVPADKVEFTFKSPESVQIGGSYPIGAIAKPDVNVDVLVRMPKECFYEKDYLNHRYHAKRYLYLRVIERNLKSSSLVRKIEWTSLQNEARKPILKVYPAIEIAELSVFCIKVIPSATLLFDTTKLNLSRNNVRAFNQGDTAMATPKYNSSILEDMFLEENMEYVRKAFHEWKSLQEALVLLKVWARNRSSIFIHDCLSGYLISIILSYLAVGPGGNHITKSMNAMQIFRVTIKFMSAANFWGKGLSLKAPGQSNMSKEDVAQYLQSFSVLLRDVSGHFNLIFRMTKAAVSELQEEASWTLNCIDKYRDGGFEEIFLTKVDFAAKFDSCLRINLKENEKVNAIDFCLDDERWRICENLVYSHLQHGLSDRAKLIRVTWRSTPSKWNIEDGFLKFGNEQMLVGILLSSHENSFRMVDVGPSAHNKEEALKFRKFWGEKAELRRFKDGNIAESTVWQCQDWDKHLIIKRITEYILTKHFLLSEEDMVHVVDQLDFCLHVGGKDPISFSGDLIRALEVLSKRLRLLDEIPLKISSVQPLDPALSHTSVFPPEPHPLAFEKGVASMPKFATTCIQPIEVMIQLEGSGNWPLDITAIEKTKSAFLLKVGESLQNRWGMFCTATEDAVDVFTSGYAFRLKILHERGLNLVRTQVGNNKIKSTASVDKDLFIRSQHSSIINGLHGRYPIYGPVVRLAKRWVSSHLFSSFLTEEAIELVVAYLFLKPFPFHVPCSRVTGFLRFLRLLSNYDWAFSPLIVDINDDFSSKDEKEINENFILSRKSYVENVQDVMPALFLATTYDRTSEAWTKFSPNRLVLRRMVSYAQSSADLLTNLILLGQNGSFTWECLFRTPLNNYDAVVLLHQDKLSYPQRLLFPAEVNHGKHVIRGKASKHFQPYTVLGNGLKSLEDARSKLLVDFDPTRYFLEDLKGEFPDTFKVWYDSFGGDAIGLTWERKVSKKRNRDEAGVSIKEPVKLLKGVEPVELLKDVGEVGKGFVKSVYLLKAPKLQS